MPTTEKTAVIEELRESFDGAAAILLADFTGLDVESMTKLRRKCREKGVTLAVVKNTLAIKAAKSLQLDELATHFKGATAVAVSDDDPTSPARILMDFRKDHEKLQVKFGLVEGRALTPQEVKALATMPSREVLISQVMQLAMAPTQNLLWAIKDTVGRVVRTVDAIRDGMEKGTIPSKGRAES
ncbi:MAG: 50S ribosomal protein L10 [bacterium]